MIREVESNKCLTLRFPRFSFCALATLALLGQLDAVDTDATASFVLSCMNFDGGFGSRPGAESHAGLIYTCVGRFTYFFNSNQKCEM